LRMSAHIRNGQPSVVFLDQLRAERNILGYIGDWSQQEGRTEEELRIALAQFEQHFHMAGHSIDAAMPLLADAALVRATILGKEPSIAQALEPESLSVHLAFLANKLPWERERALRALDRITAYNNGNVATKYQNWALPQEPWVIAEPKAATSYLMSVEYVARNSMHELARAEFDTEAVRRATLLRIALALYRLDRNEYPPRLDLLVPDYVANRKTLLDPYSEQPFQYEPRGLDLPLNIPGWTPRRSAMQIPPNTPFFWSVGPKDMRLSETATAVSEPNDEGAENGVVQQYSLFIHKPENWFPSNEPLVFPLALIDE